MVYFPYITWPSCLVFETFQEVSCVELDFYGYFLSRGFLKSSDQGRSPKILKHSRGCHWSQLTRLLVTTLEGTQREKLSRDTGNGCRTIGEPLTSQVLTGQSYCMLIRYRLRFEKISKISVEFKRQQHW